MHLYVMQMDSIEVRGHISQFRFSKCRRHLDSYREHLRLCGSLCSLADVLFCAIVIYFRGLLQPVLGLSIIMVCW